MNPPKRLGERIVEAERAVSAARHEVARTEKQLQRRQKILDDRLREMNAVYAEAAIE